MRDGPRAAVDVYCKNYVPMTRTPSFSRRAGGEQRPDTSYSTPHIGALALTRAHATQIAGLVLTGLEGGRES